MKFNWSARNFEWNTLERAVFASLSSHLWGILNGGLARKTMLGTLLLYYSYMSNWRQIFYQRLLVEPIVADRHCTAFDKLNVFLL